MVEFLPAQKEDLAAIAGIYNYYILNTTATFHGEPMTEKDVGDLLFTGNPEYPAFVIRDGGRIIGYCFLARYKNRQAYNRSAELSVYLLPECTGRGIGTAALRRLEEAACGAGIRVLIGTICGENMASIRLMEQSGYTRCGHLRNIGEKFGKVLDVVLYEKEI